MTQILPFGSWIQANQTGIHSGGKIFLARKNRRCHLQAEISIYNEALKRCEMLDTIDLSNLE
jgi:hypothetical protein